MPFWHEDYLELITWECLRLRFSPENTVEVNLPNGNVPNISYVVTLESGERAVNWAAKEINGVYSHWFDVGAQENFVIASHINFPSTLRNI